jgi:hypothetical protein
VGVALVIGFDKIEKRDAQRREMRRRFARRQVGWGVFTAASAAGAVISSTGWFTVYFIIGLSCLLGYVFIDRTVESLNDMRFDWFYSQFNRKMRDILIRGIDKPPFEKE